MSVTAPGAHGGTRPALRLPRREHVRQVDHSDPLPYYYAPLTAWLYRERLRMALDLLGPGPFDRLLEAGYGSGILLPALRDRARALCAMDLHRQASVVQQMLATERTDADLAIGNVCRLGYVGGSFDALVCVSTLEHLHGEELDQAVREFRRVLRPGGVAVVGVPASGWAMDLLFRAIGFSEIGEHHVSTHGNVEEALRRHFAIDAERRLPGFAPRRVALYTVFRGRT